MTTTDAALVDQVAKVFKLACQEQDWELAEFLFQALEAIANREGNDDPVKFAYDELILPPKNVELARLRAEPARVTMERDILKKATAYFAKESL